MGAFLRRITGLMRKEFIMIAYDRGTIAMLVILPIMLLIVFGFAIQLDPKHLPTTIISYDHSPLTRSFIANLEASQYFDVVDTSNNVKAKNKKLDTGKISIAITIPSDFTRKYIRYENPKMLVEIDGTDPGSNANAAGLVPPILDQAIGQFNRVGLSAGVEKSSRNIGVVFHRLYNQSYRSSFYIVPGLIGVLLTLTMVMLTSTAITSERETGTMEMLLVTPLTATEIILGKVIPYIVLGYLQLSCVLIFGKLLIHIPTEGSLVLLYVATAPFIIANLMVGMIFSTLAKTPMQAMQLSVFFQLPSMFLSGYVFSFFGMPHWARIIGYCLPMTYFVRIVRGILLKGNTLNEIVPNMIPILIITVILVVLGKKIFGTTLD